MILKSIRDFAGHLLKGIWQGTSRAEEWIAASGLFLLFLFVFGLVVTRYVLKISTPYFEELSRYLLIMIIFIGSVIATRWRVHIKVDLLPMIVRHRLTQDIIDVCLSFFLFVTCSLCTYFWYGYVMATFALPSYSLSMPALHMGWTRIPPWIGMILLSVAYAVRVVRDSSNLVKKFREM